MGTSRLTCRFFLFVLVAATGCSDDRNGGNAPPDDTTLVGTFDGLFNDVVVGFNYPYDIGIVPGGIEADVPALRSGDILVANYGTSEVLLARGPDHGGSAEPFYDGNADGLRGAMGVAVPPDGTVWAAFERGGDGDEGGIAVLDDSGAVLAILDNANVAGAFANPGGICFGETGVDPLKDPQLLFVVNKGDGSVWRIEADIDGANASATKIGAGLATGTLGNPGVAPDGVSNKDDLPEGGARGCAYRGGYVYVADAQNARVVRFDDADIGSVIDGVELKDTPSGLVTYPTGVTINAAGALIIISFDNAKAFVSVETPDGAFIENGLHDLNVNSGNYAVQVADDTIWFTRANNANGALRALTRTQDEPPTTDGDFPPQ